MPVVVAVEGNVETMFFSIVMQLKAKRCCSSIEGHLLKASCKWLSIPFCSSEAKVAELELQSVDDQVVAFKEPEPVALRGDFDCSDGSLASKDEHYQEWCNVSNETFSYPVE